MLLHARLGLDSCRGPRGRPPRPLPGLPDHSIRLLEVVHGHFLSAPLAQGTWLLKESFGPRKENNSLKGPLLNHLTSERTKHNFSSILMLQASCIYRGLISPCPETYHPLHPPRRLITPCPTTSVISAKEYSNPS